MKVLVAGGTGMLGREVVAGLKARGVDVRVLTRDASRAAGLGVADVAVGDARKAKTLARVCDGVDAVFSSLGASVALRYGAGYRGYKAVDVPANLNLLAEARRAGVGRVVYVSAFVVPETKDITYFAAHEAVAKEVLALPGGHVLRPTAFYSALTAFVDMARRGALPLFGDGSSRSNPIDDRCIADVAVKTLVDGGPREQDLGGPEVMTRRRIAELAFEAVGTPIEKRRYRQIAPWIVRTGAVMLTPFSPRLSQLVSFAVQVSTRDLVAPTVGTRALADAFVAHAARTAAGRAGA